MIDAKKKHPRRAQHEQRRQIRLTLFLCRSPQATNPFLPYLCDVRPVCVTCSPRKSAHRAFRRILTGCAAWQGNIWSTRRQCPRSGHGTRGVRYSHSSHRDFGTARYCYRSSFNGTLVTCGIVPETEGCRAVGCWRMSKHGPGCCAKHAFAPLCAMCGNSAAAPTTTKMLHHFPSDVTAMHCVYLITESLLPVRETAETCLKPAP